MGARSLNPGSIAATADTSAGRGTSTLCAEVAAFTSVAVMLSRVWSIDPGLRATGLADVVDGRVAGAALIRSVATEGWAEWQGPDGVAIEHVIRLGTAWFLERPAPTLIVYEWPTIYPGSEENPNDLPALTAIDLGIVSRLRAAGVIAPACPVLARIWTGGTKKSIRHRRWLGDEKSVGTVVGKISDAERAILEEIRPPHLRHNTVDACTMGIWVAVRGRGY